MLNFFNGLLVLVKVMVLLLFLKTISFIINQKEIALLYNIRTRLGFGKVTIYHQNGVKYGRYHVQSRKLFPLAMLFNGNLV
jgi:hypothetical protein